MKHKFLRHLLFVCQEKKSQTAYLWWIILRRHLPCMTWASPLGEESFMIFHLDIHRLLWSSSQTPANDITVIVDEGIFLIHTASHTAWCIKTMQHLFVTNRRVRETAFFLWLLWNNKLDTFASCIQGIDLKRKSRWVSSVHETLWSNKHLSRIDCILDFDCIAFSMIGSECQVNMMPEARSDSLQKGEHKRDKKKKTFHVLPSLSCIKSLLNKLDKKNMISVVRTRLQTNTTSVAWETLLSKYFSWESLCKESMRKLRDLERGR